MIITCPECSAQFLLPDNAVIKPRRVKCAICTHIWTQMPEDPIIESIDLAFEESLPSSPDPSLLADIREASHPITRRRNVGAMIKQVVIVALSLLFVSSTAALILRDVVVAAWPPAALLYEKIHLDAPVAGKGLELRDLSVNDKNTASGVLSISGKMSNITGQPVIMPDLRVVQTGKGKDTKEWLIDLHGRSLAAQQTVSFHYDLKNALLEAQQVKIIFSNK